jgi:hypothetical protein
MKEKLLLGELENVEKLAEILSRSKNVTRFDDNDNKEAWTIAYGFRDIEESFQEFLKLLHKLLDDKITDSEINDLLFDIGEEFRHILYHIKDIKLYDHLI